MVSAGARVHVQQVRGGVAHDPEDMGMARDEERRLGGGDFFPGVRRVIARVAAHVSHVDIEAEAAPVKVFTDPAADLGSVDIAVDGAEGLESLKATEDAWSEVTSVPDFVTFSEVFEDCVVEKAVRVGHEAYAHASGMITCREDSLSPGALEVVRLHPGSVFAGQKYSSTPPMDRKTELSRRASFCRPEEWSAPEIHPLP